MLSHEKSVPGHGSRVINLGDVLSRAPMSRSISLMFLAFLAGDVRCGVRVSSGGGVAAVSGGTY